MPTACTAASTTRYIAHFPTSSHIELIFELSDLRFKLKQLYLPCFSGVRDLLAKYLGEVGFLSVTQCS